MSCSVCNHPERQAIDLALLNRTSNLPRLSREHHLSTSALHRHKQHLLQKTAAAQTRFRSLLREGSLVILSSLLERLLGITRTAEAEGNTAQVLQGARQSTDIIKLMHKLDLDLDPDSLYRLLESPKYLDQGVLLPTDLHFTAASRQALADHLLASCPEPDPEVETALESDLAAALAALDPERLRNVLASLARSLEVTETAPAGNREKSGKKAKKDRGCNKDLERYQPDSQCDKNIGKSPPSSRITPPVPARQPDLQGRAASVIDPAGEPGSWVKDLDEGRLDIDLLHAIGAGRPVDLNSGVFAAHRK